MLLDNFVDNNRKFWVLKISPYMVCVFALGDEVVKLLTFSVEVAEKWRDTAEMDNEVLHAKHLE